MDGHLNAALASAQLASFYYSKLCCDVNHPRATEQSVKALLFTFAETLVDCVNN